MADIKFLKINTIDKWDQPIYNDVEFLANNDIAQIYDNNYIAQAVAKVLRTDQNSTVPFPNYGTMLTQIRKSVVGDSLLESQVTDNVVSALSYIKTLEASPNESEKIAGVTNIKAETVNLDTFTKAMSLELTVVAKNGKVTTVTI